MSKVDEWMNKQQWRNGTDMKNRNKLGQNQSQRHLIHHKSHTCWTQQSAITKAKWRNNRRGDRERQQCICKTQGVPLQLFAGHKDSALAELKYLMPRTLCATAAYLTDEQVYKFHEPSCTLYASSSCCLRVYNRIKAIKECAYTE